MFNEIEQEELPRGTPLGEVVKQHFGEMMDRYNRPDRTDWKPEPLPEEVRRRLPWLTFNADTITAEQIGLLLRSKDDSVHRQLHVLFDGTVFLSDLTGMLGLESVAIYFEIFCAENGYTGPGADRDGSLSVRLKKALNQEWEWFKLGRTDAPEYVDVF